MKSGMLKTSRDEHVWLVTQPDHGQIAGYLAAHWGNERFRTLGSYASALDPGRLRSETVFAIAEHDNGWWEWEAAPNLSESDRLPMDLGEVLKFQQAGMDRWRKGLGRFVNNPYANLLISHHAYWLYAARALPDPDPAFTHPLFWKGSPEKLYPGSREDPLKFIAELEHFQSEWMEILSADRATLDWVAPDHLLPHVRLLQLCDGMSLALCSALIPAKSGDTRGFGEDEFELHDVPRRGWSDRVTLRFMPRGSRRIAVSPYPFDIDPLPVVMPVRIVSVPVAESNFQTWWHALQPQLIEFEYVSAD